MGGLPARVWVAADEVCKIINDGIWTSGDGPSIGWGESRMAVGNAILAERKRCADVARSWASVANSVLNSGDGFSEAHWNGRLFAAEYIAKEIESGE